MTVSSCIRSIDLHTCASPDDNNNNHKNNNNFNHNDNNIGK